jgi:hypothetical protein
VHLLFTAPGRVALKASLPSVANGAHDAELRRWAAEVAAWGGEVDLTILEHVDRDWVVTSAVANSGIPADSARAWEHVRAVFRSGHADRVSWVWAPADPGADTAYAPPPGTYDAVLLGLIEYPGAAWQDPATELARTRQSHPDAKIIVETSIAGPDAERTAWLQRLGETIGARGDVTSLVYLEGGPAPVASASERAAWSLSDQPDLAKAFQDSVHLAHLDGGSR